jgi:hypothetical protein
MKGVSYGRIYTGCFYNLIKPTVWFLIGRHGCAGSYGTDLEISRLFAEIHFHFLQIPFEFYVAGVLVPLHFQKSCKVKMFIYFIHILKKSKAYEDKL